MTTRNDFDKQLAAFLEDGATELSDGALQSVHAGVSRTRQRAVLGPWRNPMSNLTRAIVLVAALIAVLAVGLIGGVGRPVATTGPDASATATPTGAATTVPTPAPPAYRWPRTLLPGTYTTAFAWNMPIALTFTVPAGWESRDIEVIKAAMSVSVQLVGETFRDACSGDVADGPTGETAADLTSAIALLPDLDASAADTATIGGMPAAHLTYEAAPGVSCVGESSHLWAIRTAALLQGVPVGAPSWPLRAGSHEVWVVELAGERLLIDATAGPTPSASDEAELAGIVDSIRFGPPAEPRAYGACRLTVTNPALGADALAEPYVGRMGTTTFPLQAGALPEVLPSPPYLQLDFEIQPFGPLGGAPEDRMNVGLAGPRWPDGGGLGAFKVENDENGDPAMLGSFLLDGPGTWWTRIWIPAADCYRQFSVEVLPPA